MNRKQIGRRSQVAFGLVLLLWAAIALSACGGSSSSSSSSSSGESTSSEPETTESSSSETAESETTEAGSSANGEELYSEEATIGYLAPSKTITRWFTEDIPDYEEAMKTVAPNVKILTFQANGSVATQLEQAKSAITQGAKVLLVASASSEQSGGLVSYANQNNVPVVVMERPIDNANTCCQIGSNPVEIGEEAGKWLLENTKKGDSIALIEGDPTDSFAVEYEEGEMKILEPAFESGERKLAAKVYTPEYLPENAHKEMDAILTKTHGEIDAVDAFNDDMAQAVLSSLDRYGLAGKIPVKGIDGTLEGIQSIVQGRETMTIFRPYTYLAGVAAKATAYLLKEEEFPKGLFPLTVNNGTKTIPFAAAPSVIITQKNVGRMIKEGVYSKEEVCEGAEPGAAGIC